ncbi:MAG: hypothetical protein NZL99_07135 [Burkholderiaceae bacterium]|nr:hypothetical protein [Burkholderiaceae bacterium]
MSPERALRVAWVLWPSFLVAAAAEVVFFAVFDPADLHPFGLPIDADRLPLYTVFFFFFWLIGAAASALTVFLQRSPFEVNRCPLEEENRPAGCPKRPQDAVSQDAVS